MCSSPVECGLCFRSGRNGFTVQIIDYAGLERFHIETSNF